MPGKAEQGSVAKLLSNPSSGACFEAAGCGQAQLDWSTGNGHCSAFHSLPEFWNLEANFVRCSRGACFLALKHAAFVLKVHGTLGGVSISLVSTGRSWPPDMRLKPQKHRHLLRESARVGRSTWQRRIWETPEQFLMVISLSASCRI